MTKENLNASLLRMIDLQWLQAITAAQSRPVVQTALQLPARSYNVTQKLLLEGTPLQQVLLENTMSAVEDLGPNLMMVGPV